MEVHHHPTHRHSHSDVTHFMVQFADLYASQSAVEKQLDTNNACSYDLPGSSDAIQRTGHVFYCGQAGNVAEVGCLKWYLCRADSNDELLLAEV